MHLCRGIQLSIAISPDRWNPSQAGVGKKFRPSFGVIKPENEDRYSIHRTLFASDGEFSGAGGLGKFRDHLIDCAP
ncbi:hypothetical protein IVA78_19600 [Bradyrhizobium sp. 137]|uniref:hypothetical protein n=1 Tax=Bradyrhizobium sp. 137 TaxID=2782614 RepID=UPI001FFB7E41|nr:hypothetical protein [Bradyrhizobium sp. 137]MCK1757366.1 hypothetical protein [Bradyrhizobium sp. 137]